MALHPFWKQFSIFREQDSSFSARWMRKKFIGKVKDSFYMVSGLWLEFVPVTESDKENFASSFNALRHPLKYKMEVRREPFALIDFPLFMLWLVGCGLNYCSDFLIKLTNKSNIFLKIIGYISLIIGIVSGLPLGLVKLLACAVVTAITLPFIFGAHLWFEHQSKHLKQTFKVNEDEVSKLDLQPISPSWDPEAEYKYASISSILDNSYNKSTIKAIRFAAERTRIIYIEHALLPNSYHLFLNTVNGRAAFDSFIQLNIGNYEKFITEHPVLDEEKASTISTTTRNLINGFATLSQINRVQSSNTAILENAELRLPTLSVELLDKIGLYIADNNSLTNKDIASIEEQFLLQPVKPGSG